MSLADPVQDFAAACAQSVLNQDLANRMAEVAWNEFLQKMDLGRNCSESVGCSRNVLVSQQAGVGRDLKGHFVTNDKNPETHHSHLLRT